MWKKALALWLALLCFVVLLACVQEPTLLASAVAAAIPTEEPDTDTRDMSIKVTEAIRDYCPEGTYIIETAIQKYTWYKDKEFVDIVARWTDMMQADNVFKIAGTIVHEETHTFQGLDFASHFVDGQQLSIQKDIAGLFPIDPAQCPPPSEIMAETIPESLRTTRYSRYVGKGVNKNSNTGGVTGLLKELEAYHQGARATYELFALLKERPVRESEYFDYFTKLNNDSEAFYEMTFFILTYMMHLKDYNPAMYETLLARKGIWTAFKYNYEAFKALAQSIPARNEELLLILVDHGYQAKLIGEPFAGQQLRIGNTAKSTGNDVTVLMEALNTPDYTECLELLLGLGLAT